MFIKIINSLWIKYYKFLFLFYFVSLCFWIKRKIFLLLEILIFWFLSNQSLSFFISICFPYHFANIDTKFIYVNNY